MISKVASNMGKGVTLKGDGDPSKMRVKAQKI